MVLENFNCAHKSFISSLFTTSRLLLLKMLANLPSYNVTSSRLDIISVSKSKKEQKGGQQKNS